MRLAPHHHNSPGGRLPQADGREALRDRMLTKMQERTLDERMELYVDAGNVAAEPFRYAADGMKHEQFVDNGHALEIADPRVGRLKTAGLIARLGDTPGETGGPAPEIGQHNAEVLQRIGRQNPGAPAVVAANASIRVSGKPALQGLTMLDLSMVIAGPYAAAMLAGMDNARPVIHWEELKRLPSAR